MESRPLCFGPPAGIRIQASGDEGLGLPDISKALALRRAVCVGRNGRGRALSAVFSSLVVLVPSASGLRIPRTAPQMSRPPPEQPLSACKVGAHSLGVLVSDRRPVSFGSRGQSSVPSFGTGEGQFRGARLSDSGRWGRGREAGGRGSGCCQVTTTVPLEQY